MSYHEEALAHLKRSNPSVIPEFETKYKQGVRFHRYRVYAKKRVF